MACITPCNQGKFPFPFVAISIQLLLLVFFGVFVEYSEYGLPLSDASTAASSLHAVESKAQVQRYYSMFQEVRVMMIVGFGFLMTFLKRYGFGSVGFNLLLGAFVIQWSIITNGWILHFETGVIRVDMAALVAAEFTTAAVLVSCGAVIGKLSPLQLLVMAAIEVVVYQANQLIVFNMLKVSDTGTSMVVHAFGAYFGLAVSKILYRPSLLSATDNQGSVYHSDMFAIIGTVFLWLFYPSFNAIGAAAEGQYRAVVNTYLALAASAVTTFALSSLVNTDKLNMLHIQNATIAGGVAVGTMADMIIQPWGAVLIGMTAASLSVLGFQFLTPVMLRVLKVHDTCGVHNLHGMPGIVSGFGGAVTAALATPAIYGNNLYTLFPEIEHGRSVEHQAVYQMAGLGVCLGLSLGGGTITGFILRIPIWDQPREEDLFMDSSHWLVPPDGLPVMTGSEDAKEYISE